MKTFVLSIALMMAGSVVSFGHNAQGFDNPQDTTEAVVQQEQEDVYTEVALTDLNEKVQTAINSLTDAYTIKALGYNAEKKLTKVTLISKVDEKESVVILDDEGKLVQ